MIPARGLRHKERPQPSKTIVSLKCRNDNKQRKGLNSSVCSRCCGLEEKHIRGPASTHTKLLARTSSKEGILSYQVQSQSRPLSTLYSKSLNFVAFSPWDRGSGVPRSRQAGLSTRIAAKWGKVVVYMRDCKRPPKQAV